MFDILAACLYTNLVSRPLVFVFQFAFSIIQKNERAAKNGEGLGTLTIHVNDIRWTQVGIWGGCIQIIYETTSSCALSPGKTPDIHMIPSTLA